LQKEFVLQVLVRDILLRDVYIENIVDQLMYESPGLSIPLVMGKLATAFETL
jgi:hypothetical protein